MGLEIRSPAFYFFMIFISFARWSLWVYILIILIWKTFFMHSELKQIGTL